MWLVNRFWVASDFLELLIKEVPAKQADQVEVLVS